MPFDAVPPSADFCNRFFQPQVAEMNYPGTQANALHAKFPDNPPLIAGDDDQHLEATQGINPVLSTRQRKPPRRSVAARWGLCMRRLPPLGSSRRRDRLRELAG